MQLKLFEQFVTEREVLASCKEYLERRGLFVWRNNTMGVFDKATGRYYFHGMRGCSDLLGCLPDGRFFACETKKPGGKKTPEQAVFLERIAALRGVALCVSSVGELEQDLRELGLV